MSFGFEGFGKKKELFQIEPENTELFENWYGVNDEAAFNDNVRSVAEDLRKKMQGQPVDENMYIGTLEAIKGFAEGEGATFADLHAVEMWVSKSKLMEDVAGEESLQTYLANSPVNGNA